MIRYWLIIYIGVMHFFDMFYTYKMIKSHNKKWKNGELFEINYHRWFFKKFGLMKGTILSFCLVSLPIILLVAFGSEYFYREINTTLFMSGMITAIAYVNYMSHNHEKTLMEELVPTDKHREYLKKVIERK